MFTITSTASMRGAHGHNACTVLLCDVVKEGVSPLRASHCGATAGDHCYALVEECAVLGTVGFLKGAPPLHLHHAAGSMVPLLTIAPQVVQLSVCRYPRLVRYPVAHR